MEREYRRPRLVIEEVRRKYKFLNTTGVRCNLKSDGESDYSVAYENNRHSSPCSGMYYRDCIFGNLTTQEELKKAKEYWYSKMISEKINDIELLLL